MPDPITDTDLTSAYRAGDSDAFAGLYDRYADRVFSRLLDSGWDRSEAIELTHDLFIEVAGRILDSGPPEEFGPWLLRIGEEHAGLPAGELGDLPPTEMASAPPALRARVLRKTDDKVIEPSPPAAAPGREISPYWLRMGVFALVAIVVGLVGLAVSAQFQPLSPPATTPVSSDTGSSAPGPASTTTTVARTATTRPVGSTTVSTRAAAPASIEASTETVDLGPDSTSGRFDLTNSGDGAAEWALSPSTSAVAVSVGEGRLEGGESITIELDLDRDEIGEGDLTETLTITWDDGEFVVNVVASHEDNPIIHNPQASPSSVVVSGGDECEPATSTVSARVRDTSELESVVVQWSPDGGGQQETAMSPVGNEMFEGVVGPFSTEQSAPLRIVAFDERGNAGGATIQLPVTACE